MSLAPSPNDVWTGLQNSLKEADNTTYCAEAARIQREVSSLGAENRLPPHVRPLKIACLRSVTIEPVLPLLAASMVLHDFSASIDVGQLGNHVNEMLSADSFVGKGGYDVCIVLLPFETVVADLDNPNAKLDDVCQSLHLFFKCLEALASRFTGLIIVCNFPPSGNILARRFQSHSPASSRYAVHQANQLLACYVEKHARVVISDLAFLSQQIGTDRFYSPRNMMAISQPFSVDGFRLVCRDWAELCAIHFRGTPKCIVVDCDGTLWGGIVGEDGVHGIRLGESYPGVCYQQFQCQLKHLKELGFLLAINSKNNETDVRAVFEKNPAMILKFDDCAAARINWDDKATNLAALAEELNLSVDSFVFIDDSEFELNLVKSVHPNVTCLLVPRETWNLPSLLPMAGCLDRLSLTREDSMKTEMYAQDRKRKTFQDSAGSYDEYLQQLKLEMTFEYFAENRHLERAVQLLQKTNQFNLTTRRHSKSELLGLVQAGAKVCVASLKDRFGDYGRIALAIVVFDAEIPLLDTFLMSCRAIGRKAEIVFLQCVMERLRALGHQKLRAQYVPSERNQVCAGFLAEHGFQLVNTSSDNVQTYECKLKDAATDIMGLYRIIGTEGDT